MGMTSQERARALIEQWYRDDHTASGYVTMLEPLIAAAIDAAVEEEREACAHLVENSIGGDEEWNGRIADQIRARSGNKHSAPIRDVGEPTEQVCDECDQDDTCADHDCPLFGHSVNCPRVCSACNGTGKKKQVEEEK